MSSPSHCQAFGMPAPTQAPWDANCKHAQDPIESIESTMSGSTAWSQEASAPVLVWCNECCLKVTQEAMADSMRQLAHTCGYVPMFFRKAFGLSDWIASKKAPDQQYILITDWREFKPSRIFLEKVPEEHHPLATLIFAPESVQVTKINSKLAQMRGSLNDMDKIFVTDSLGKLRGMASYFFPAPAKDLESCHRSLSDSSDTSGTIGARISMERPFFETHKDTWSPDVTGVFCQLFRDKTCMEVLEMLQAAVPAYYED